MRVLIADDDPVSRLRLERVLTTWGYETIAVADGEAAWRILSDREAPRLAILDWLMPGIDGVSLCHKLRAQEGVPYTYVVLLTSRGELHSLVEAMDAGADDYLIKPCQPHELRVRLRAGKRIAQLQEALIDARESLREQATRDDLTGASNRRAILVALDRELARVERSPAGPGLGLLIADLDYFKRVNDSYGHFVGDEVLCEVVRRITGQVRQYDSLGRIGGEEFLILLADCNREHVKMAAERIRCLIADQPVETTAGPVPVTLSLGASWVPSGRHVTARQFLSAADRALYAAKTAGRDRLCFDEQRPSAKDLLLFKDPERPRRILVDGLAGSAPVSRGLRP